MPADDRVRAVAREWVIKAENDLINARHSVKLGKECPTDTVCFHAQQCVEKYIKALLVMAAVEFPKVHDIEKLVRLLPEGVLGDWALVEQRRLTTYAAITRYPGSYEPILLSEARAAIRIARRVRSELRRELPRAVVTSPRNSKHKRHGVKHPSRR